MAHPDPMTPLPDVPRDPCRATNRQGAPCGQLAIPGGTVCRFHGGDAPQVRRAAERRLAALASRVLDRWHQALSDDEVPWPVRVQVGRDVLDRLGVGADERSAATGRTSAALHLHQHTTHAPDLDAIIAQALQRSADQSRAYLDRQAASAATYGQVVEEGQQEGGPGGTGDGLAEAEPASLALPDAVEQGPPSPPSPPPAQ